MIQPLALTAVIFVVLLHSVAQSFNQKSLLKISNANFKRATLTTAGRGCSEGFIPKLEPGLRLLRNHLYEEGLTITTLYPLEMLKETDAVESVLENKSDTNLGQLFGSAAQTLRRFGSVCAAYLKKVVSATLLFAASLNPMPNFKTMSISANSVIAAVAAAPGVAHASSVSKYETKSPTQKLATTPLYYVSNSRGNSYLQDDVQAGNPDQKIIVYFMSSEDATRYLYEMAQTNSQSANEFRIMTTSMERVVDSIQSRKQSRKLGRYKMDIVYRIQPSSRQCDNAETVAGRAKVEGVSIPMFSAKGLGMTRSNGEYISPYYFAYEDLLEDWNTMRSARPESRLPATPKVIVSDFTDVMCLADGIGAQSLYPNNSKLRSCLQSLN